MISINLTSEQVVNSIRLQKPVHGQALRAFWLAQDRFRDQYAQELAQTAGEDPLVALVVRDANFTDPNALSANVVRLLHEHRPLFTVELETRIRRHRRLDLVLIAKTSLDMAGSDSMVPLPDWFPVNPGQLEPFQILDLTWEGRALLDADAIQLPEIAKLLFELDGELLGRVRREYMRDKNSMNALFAKIQFKRKPKGGQPPETLVEYLENAGKARMEVRSAAHFRPQYGTAFMVERLHELANITAPESLGDAGRALDTALGLAGVNLRIPYVPLVAVLGRMNNEARTTPNGRWLLTTIRYACHLAEAGAPLPGPRRLVNRQAHPGSQLLMLARDACQLSTITHHAADYQSFPINVLQSVSIDLRKGLASAIQFLREMP